MDKLNKFILKEGDKLEKLGRDEIFLKAGVESVVYVENGDLEIYKQNRYQFLIGAFFHSLFWLNSNQTDFIRFRLQNNKKNKNISITLDQV